MGGSNNKGDGLASQPRRYRVPGQPLLNRHQVGGVPRSPDGLFAQQDGVPIRGRPAVRGKRTYGGRPGQRVEEQGTWAAQKHSEAGYGRPVDRGVWTAKTVKQPRQQPAHPQYANYWAPLTRKRHTMPHSAQPQHTNYWAPRTRKRRQQEHRPQRPTESSDPTQHAKGRTGDCPGPRKETTTRRNVTRGVGTKPWDVAPGSWTAFAPLHEDPPNAAVATPGVANEGISSVSPFEIRRFETAPLALSFFWRFCGVGVGGNLSKPVTEPCVGPPHHSHCTTWFQTQPILTACQIRYLSHLWDHRSTRQL